MSSSLILCNKNEPFLDQIVTCNKKWILYDNQWHPAQGLHWEEAPKHFPKPNLHPKKGHGHCGLVVCCQPDPLQLFEFWRNHYIWEVCSANWWDTPKPAMPAAGIGQQKGPNSPRQHLTAYRTTNASKVERTELRSFTSSTVFTRPLAKWLPLQASWKLLSGKMLLQGGGRKCFPSILTSLNSKAWMFMLQE